MADFVSADIEIVEQFASKSKEMIIKDILDSINNSVLNDIKDNYNQLDQELGDFNRNPPSDDGVSGGGMAVAAN